MIEVGNRFVFVTSEGEQRGPYVVEDIVYASNANVVTLRREGVEQAAQVYERWLTEAPTKGRAHWLPEVPFQ